MLVSSRGRGSASMLAAAAVDPAEVLAELQTTVGGVTADDARRRLAIDGPNVVTEHVRVGPLGRLGRAVANPLVFVLTLATKHDWATAAFFSLAVGLTPEMLPMIVAVCLSRGALEMARERVIVKHLDLIQNLGAMDVLCTDKTGTLTLDRIILERHCDLLLREDPEVLRIGWLVSHCQTGLRSAMDRAVLEHEELEGQDPSAGYAKLDEIPFDFTRRVMSVVVKGTDAGPRLFCKGAPDAVHARCTALEIDGVVQPIDHDVPRAVLREADDLAAEGFRVLAVAYRAVEAKPAYARDDEQGLVLRGYLAVLDPPKDSARGALVGLAVCGVGHAHGPTHARAEAKGGAAAPPPWATGQVARFILCPGPVSSLFDIVTFAVLWFGFGCDNPDKAAVFHAGWFVESLVTQAVVIHVIRTDRIPFVESRASVALSATTAAVIASGIWLVHSPPAGTLGFAPRPATYWPFLVVTAAAYLCRAQLVKTWLAPCSGSRTGCGRWPRRRRPRAGRATRGGQAGGRR